MIPFSLREIASVLNAKHIGLDCMIHSIAIDSSSISDRCMFIALIGRRLDGHDFVEKAVFSGARALLVNRCLLLDVPQLIVPDTHQALITLARWVCQQVSAKFIIITGSSGKTSVKEITSAILRKCGRVVYTQGNLNNTIGVPITLLRLTKQDNFAVIELGISKFGEIDQLINIVPSNAALVNNVYPSHLSGFGSLIKIREEKGKIFSGLSEHGIGIINADSNAFSLWEKRLQGKTVWSFSIYEQFGVNFFASDIITSNNGVRCVLHTPYGKFPVFLSMLGQHNIANVLAATALAFSVGATLSQVISGLRNMQITLPGRLYPIVLGPGKLLLDDTYNSNVGSMIAAIRVLKFMPGYRVLVISEMLELGVLRSIKYHRYIGRLIVKTSIDQVLTIGSASYFFGEMCEISRNFQDKIKLAIYLQQLLFRYTLITILIKGSRNFRMEELITFITGKI